MYGMFSGNYLRLKLPHVNTWMDIYNKMLIGKQNTIRQSDYKGGCVPMVSIISEHVKYHNIRMATYAKDGDRPPPQEILLTIGFYSGKKIKYHHHAQTSNQPYFLDHLTFKYT